MSRSRRHIPITGNTLSASEKDDKQRAAMRERKRINDRIKPHGVDSEFDLVNHVEHPRSGQWVFAKDGKHYRRHLSAKDMRK